MKIYVPDLENYQCVVVQGEGIIRAYETTPHTNTTVNYRDYYIESSYIYRDGTQSFSNYATLPVCLDKNTVLTSEVYYRNDFDKILVIFVILCIIFFWFPIKIFTRLFKRWSL